MNARKKTWLGAGLIAALTWVGTQASAAVGNPSYLNIDVTVSAQLSVSVNGVNNSTYTGVNWNTANANQELVAASSTTVVNDSNVVEKWQLTAANRSSNIPGNAESWALVTSTHPTAPSTDQYAVQAVFGSSRTVAGGCPGVAAATWQNGTIAPLLNTASPKQYTSTQLADPTLNAEGAPYQPSVLSSGNMFAGHQRTLCWRIVAPAATTTTDAQNVQLVVTAIP